MPTVNMISSTYHLVNVYPLETVFSTHCLRIVIEIPGEEASTSKTPPDKSVGDKILTDKDKEDINKDVWLFN